MEPSKKLVAIVGAGLAGLGAAWRLAKNPNLKVTLFEKSQNISGRAATRRKSGYFYDNGANYFGTENQETLALFKEHFPHDQLITIPKPIWTFEEDGKIKEGDPEHNKKPKYDYKQGIKTFSKLVWAECQDKVDLQYNKRLDKIVQENEGKLRLVSTENEDLGVFDAVLLTPPAPQIADVFKTSDLNDKAGQKELQESFSECRYKSIISFALVFKGRLEKEYFALINSDRKHNISWLSFENDKEGHVPDNETMMIVQMADDWSKKYYEEKDEELLSKVFEEVRKIFPEDKLEERYNWGDVKKWKFALPEKTINEKVFEIGRRHNLFFAGDFVRGKGRVLDAFEEGLKTGDLINKEFSSPSSSL